jgi:hypothetical protein
MILPSVIDKNKPLQDSQRYAFLRTKGLEYIQALSGKIWTDHNTHDPGITILEVLCYALTDLGYRTGFDIKDILATPDGAVDPPEISTLYPAHEILPSAPLTIIDYRRLLVKIEGVRNAWLDPMTDPAQEGNYKESEVAFYADCSAGKLSFDQKNAEGEDNPRVRVSGLYKILLEFEKDDVLGSLNERLLVFQVRRGPLKGLVLSLDSQDPTFPETKIDLRKDFKKVQSVEIIGQDKGLFSLKVVLQFTDNTQVTIGNLVLQVVNDKPRADEEPIPVKVLHLNALLSEEATEGEGGEDRLIPLFWRKQQARKKILDAACCVLDAHRNLCEDYLSIASVGMERVAVCADIVLENSADIEEMQARVFHAIEQYLNPPLRYFTLKECLDDGMSPDEIFNGPYIDYALTCHGERVFTKPGFVKKEDLENSELRQVIYVSDLMNIIMDIVGIVSVKNVLLRKYDANGLPVAVQDKWCTTISPNHQPVLDIERSKALFFKEGIPYRAQAAEFQETLDHLRGLDRKAAYVEPNQVLEIPKGRYRELDQCFPVQHDFPNTYGIGPAGLPAKADNLRIAQAQQLKAYLTFFDQVLADYLAQLANVRQLFSLDQTLGRTYFSKYMTDIVGTRNDFESEFYVDGLRLQGYLQGADPNPLVENEELYFARRNQVLDHLTARFSEQFADYVLMTFNVEGDRIKVGKDLIDDKISFLQAYPVLSRERHQACNYRPEDSSLSWDSNNVSGLEKRVSRLVGMDKILKRNLACQKLSDELFGTRSMSGKFRLEIKTSSNSIVFKSQELFASRESAMTRGLKLFPYIRQEASYTIDTSGGTGQVFYQIHAGGTSLRNDELFDTEADAVRDIREIIDRYDEILHTEVACDDEGFHLIEHILLRPYTTHDQLMDVCLDSSCEFCGEEDPYSFQISVVLPYWPPRFRNLHFRRFFEQTLREETPAHIHPKICWIGNEQMTTLDGAYREWLTAKSKMDIDQAMLAEKTKTLIGILQQLKTVYPAATLHDCVEGQDENPVRLGSTNLGIF